jgi:hypothetical protein
VFDPYNGVYFNNKQGDLANIEEIIKGDWVKESIDTVMQSSCAAGKKSEIDYNSYLKNLSPITETGLKRANIQSPLKRLEYGIKERLR